jgi:hypothetical protein
MYTQYRPAKDLLQNSTVIRWREYLYDEERLTESEVERPLMEKHHHLNTSSLKISHQTRKCITVA